MVARENEPDVDADAVTDYETQALDFLAKGRQYLAAGDSASGIGEGLGRGGAHGQGCGGRPGMAV